MVGEPGEESRRSLFAGHQLLEKREHPGRVQAGAHLVAKAAGVGPDFVLAPEARERRRSADLNRDLRRAMAADVGEPAGEGDADVRAFGSLHLLNAVPFDDVLDFMAEYRRELALVL